MRITIATLLLGVITAQAHAQSSASTFHMDSQVSLMSNLVEYGVTQTKKDPALKGDFWFNFGPQFRLGVTGNNVSYEDSTSHFLLRANAELRIVFSPNSDLAIRYSEHRYFAPEDRNGNVFGAHLRLWDAGVHYEQLSNFMGLESATAFSLSKSWDVFSTWRWENVIGYVTPNSDIRSSFFYYETYLGTKPAAIYYQLGATYNSSSGNYPGAADPMLVLKASVSF